MPESFGARLRQQREDRQIDLVAIAEQTKIKLALLEGLEHDDVSHWPSGIYRRAYIRAYAQFIGLDADASLREFLEAYPDPGDAAVASAAGAAAAEEEYAKQAPSMRFRSIVDSALGSLIRLGRPAAPEVRPSAAPVAVMEHPLDIVDAPEVSLLADRDAAPAAELRLDAVIEPVEIAAEEQPAPAPPFKEAAAPVLPEVRAEAVEPPAEIVEAPAPPQAVVEAPAAVSRPGETEVLETVSRICTEFGRVIERATVRDLLQESAVVLQAAGLIVWLADDSGEFLRPGLVHGYSEKILACLPAVTRDADNATAAAFRTGKPCEVAASERNSGALVVPLLIPDGCSGVLAVELQHGVRAGKSLRAVAVLLAAALTQLVHRSRPAEQPVQAERPVPAVAQFRPAARPMKVRR